MTRFDDEPMSEALDTAVKRFLDKVWITKGSRFNAHRRLLGKHTSSQFALAVLSIYAISASIATLVLPADKYPNLVPAMSAGTIVASVFVLVQGLLESAKNYQLRAHQMFKCGEKLSHLYNECAALLSIGSISEVDYMNFVERYSIILADYSENHADIDYLLFRTSHRKPADGQSSIFHRSGRKAFLVSQNVLHIWGSSAFYIAAPPIAVFVAARWIQL